MAVVNEDYFRLIELAGPAGATADYIAERAGAKLSTVHTWLSRWTKRKCLIHIPYTERLERTERRKVGRPVGSTGRYVLGPVDWSTYRWRDEEDIDTERRKNE